MPRPGRLANSKMPMKLRSTVLLPRRWRSLTAVRQTEALLREKCFNNRFAVEYRGSDEIDQPMQLLGKSGDLWALWFSELSDRTAGLNKFFNPLGITVEKAQVTSNCRTPRGEFASRPCALCGDEH